MMEMINSKLNWLVNGYVNKCIDLEPGKFEDVVEK